MKFNFCVFFLCNWVFVFSSQTIEEKFAALSTNHYENAVEKPQQPENVNQNLSHLMHTLREKYQQVHQLLEEEAEESSYKGLLTEVNQIRGKINTISEQFRWQQSEEMKEESDPLGMWQQTGITLSDMVIHYGSQDYLYVIPPDIATMRLDLQSSLMIPRSSWQSLLEIILAQNGIGMKDINPFAKQLFQLKTDFTSVSCITTKKVQLECLDPYTRVIHLLSVAGENVKTTFYFLERFRDPKTTFVYQVGPKIAIVGYKTDVKKLVTLADNVWSEEQNKAVKVVPSQKIHPEEMIKVLRGYFGNLQDGKTSAIIRNGTELCAIPIKTDSNIVLIGPRDVVERAEDIVLETQSQVSDPSEISVSWYTCAHSAPGDLAEVLEKVYTSIVSSSIEGVESLKSTTQIQDMAPDPTNYDYPNMPQTEILPYQDTPPMGGFRPASSIGSIYDPMGRYKETVDAKVGPEKPQHFIPYPTTGTILMIVRKDTLPKIKEIIKNLDVPKKMVQIEVILCERLVTDSSRSGLNILKLGSGASTDNKGGINYDASSSASIKGLFEFFFARKKSSDFPAFNLVYNFLLLEEEAKVTTSPSVTTVNQVPTTISIATEISVNNGSAPVNSNAGIIFKESYDRQTFGIRIHITPTIHEPLLDDGDIYVTLDNDISFETIKSDVNSRPDVRKRNVKNNVRVLDGETIILGGLRTKQEDSRTEIIPFLGEIPGIGKFFGTNQLTDKNTEMFIFICPKVVKDAKTDLLKLRDEMLKERTGDMQELMNQIQEAREKKKTRTFKRSFELFFGRSGVDNTLSGV